MNKYGKAILSMAVLFSIHSLSLADLSPSDCSSLVSAKPGSTDCKKSADTIRLCIQNNMAAQLVGDPSSPIPDQFLAISRASQALAKLDFHCQYLLRAGDKAPSSGSPSAAEAQSAQLETIQSAEPPPAPQKSDSGNSLINWF